jgi:hypothetical protein
LSSLRRADWSTLGRFLPESRPAGVPLTPRRYAGFPLERTSDSKVSLRSRDASLGAGPQNAALASFGSFTREPRPPAPPRVNACVVGLGPRRLSLSALTFEPATRFARFPRPRTRGVAPHTAAASRRRCREFLQCHRPYEHVHVLRSLAAPVVSGLWVLRPEFVSISKRLRLEPNRPLGFARRPGGKRTTERCCGQCGNLFRDHANRFLG